MKLNQVRTSNDDNKLEAKFNYDDTNHMGYYVANLYNLIDDERDELLINMWDDPTELGTIRWFNWIYKPNFTVDVKEGSSIVPNDYQFYAVYPNLFNRQTTIKFAIAKTSITSVKVLNILGKEITTLFEKELTPGGYNISWEARDGNRQLLPSGVYFIRFTATGEANSYNKTIKAIFMK